MKRFEAELIRDFGTKSDRAIVREMVREVGGVIDWQSGPGLPDLASPLVSQDARVWQSTGKRLGTEATERERVLCFETAKWLCSLHDWSIFFTGTFKVNRAPKYVPRNLLRSGKSFVARKGRGKYLHSRGVSQVSALKTFNGFMARNYSQADYFVAVEPNPSSDGHHLHGLVWQSEELIRREMWKKWFERFGRCRVEPVREGKDVASYCAKYNVKRIFTSGADISWDVRVQHPVVRQEQSVQSISAAVQASDIEVATLLPGPAKIPSQITPSM